MPTSAQMLDCPPVRFHRDGRTERDCHMMMGESAAMQRLRLQIERIGPHFRTLLVRGEMGTGKELVAHALHHCSGHPHAPFTVCYGTSLNTFSEDAALDSIHGRPCSTGSGTLFIDSVEEMSQDAQHGLLRMLEQKLSARIIVSTTQDLRRMVATGAFRQDLYHRLAMVEIVMEPLRRRPEDIPALTMHFVEKFAALYEKSVDAVDPEAMEMLRRHSWPGNVRELENVICNGVLQCEGASLAVGDLSFVMHSSEMSEEERTEEMPAPLQEVIDRHVLHVLRECSGNKVRAAEILGISRSTLYRMLEGCSAQG